MKKITAALIVCAVLLFASCDGLSQTSTLSTGDAEAAQSEAEAIATAEYFSDGDMKDVSSQTENAVITLEGDTGTISDTTRGSSGTNVTVTSKGVYRITGSSEDVSVVVRDDNKSGNVYLILDNVTMSNSNYSCIAVEAAEKVIVTLVGENVLEYGVGSSDYDGAIYAEDDLTINGSGTLRITSTLHGIVCKNDLKITGGVLTVDASSVGLKAKDSVRIGGGSVTVRRRTGSFGLFSRKRPHLISELIEADEIDLEYTDAQTVRGVNVRIGSECVIDRVEYSGTLTTAADAQIGEKVKI